MADAPASPLPDRHRRFVCGFCSYCYDPQRGDPQQQVPPGTPFVELPRRWRCPWCGKRQDVFYAKRAERENLGATSDALEPVTATMPTTES